MNLVKSAPFALWMSLSSFAFAASPLVQCDGCTEVALSPGRNVLYIGASERVYHICKCSGKALGNDLGIYAEGSLVFTIPKSILDLKCIDVGAKKIEAEFSNNGDGYIGYRPVQQ